MPARWFCLLIVGFWLFATGWMFKRDWLPWITAVDEAPPFVFELADEVVTQQTSWILFRDGKKMGTARTSLKYVEGNTFEWVQSLKNLEYAAGIGGFDIKAVLPSVTTTMFVTPKGELIRFKTEGELSLKLVGFSLKAEMALSGVLSTGEVSGECVLKSELGELKQPYGPARVKSTNVFSPLQPLFRMRGVHLGKSWKLNQFNPIEDAFLAAVEAITDKLAIAIPKPAGGSKELLAEVLPEYRELTMTGGAQHRCLVIEYRGDKLVARTWVSAADGTVLRQEAYLNGDSLALERD